MTETQSAHAAKALELARLIHHASLQMAKQGDPKKCRAAYELLVPKFMEMLRFSSIEDVDRVMTCYDGLYLLLWRACEDLKMLAPFANQVGKPFGLYLRQFVQAPDRRVLLKEHAQGRPLRLGVISRASNLEGGNAIARVTFALLTGFEDLPDFPFELTLYLTRKPDAAYLEALNGRSIELVKAHEIPSMSQQALAIGNHAREKNIDILLCDEPGALQSLLFEQRAAPIQGFMEMGFAPWGIDGLDLCFMGISSHPDLLNACCEKIFPSRRPLVRSVVDGVTDPVNVERLKISFAQALSGERKENEIPFVFGNYGRLIKVTEDYLARVERILLCVERAVMFIGGTGDVAIIEAFLNRSPVKDRIVFMPSHVNGYEVSAAIDVFLDTDPFPGGVSCIEAQAKSVPVVWLKGFGTNSIGLLETLRDDEIGADDRDDYVAKAVALAEPGAYHKASERALAIAEYACDNVAAAKEMADVLIAELDDLSDCET